MYLKKKKKEKPRRQESTNVPNVQHVDITMVSSTPVTVCALVRRVWEFCWTITAAFRWGRQLPSFGPVGEGK